jgi:2-oxoisovalerate dehydrogenase E1 component
MQVVPATAAGSPAHAASLGGRTGDRDSAAAGLEGLGLGRATALWQTMVTARWVDRVEMELVNRGEAFFHVGGAGHEASAALAAHLTASDWLHLHYRDKALMLARGIPPSEFFHSLLCTARSHSAGRQMSAHLSAPELHVLSLVGPVGNNALQAVGVAHELERQGRDGRGDPPIVVCAMGDGTTQQGEVLEALGEAARARLRVLFLVEDNGLAISTPTRGLTFFQQGDSTRSEYLGIPIESVDGREAVDCDAVFARVTRRMRQVGGPAIVVMRVERLTHHTNADDERSYRSEAEIQQVRQTADPLRRLGQRLVDAGVSELELARMEKSIEASVRAAAEEALLAPNPEVIRDARAPWSGPGERAGQTRPGTEPATMLAAMRSVLRSALAVDPRVSLFGEDIEDPKGDVFGLTRGLTREFPGRVRNAALTESLIVGVSIGRALAGGRPIAFIQFADFLPLCFNQVASELGSMWWRSNGGWTAPVVILAPCGGYRPGLGPFHAQTLEATFAHIPGLDVVMPSTAADAAGLLRGVLAGGRPTLFLYPKVLLNDASVATSEDLTEVCVVPGKARVAREGADVTLVSWGATVPLCLRAAAVLAAAGVEAEVLDLRSISPWDREQVLASVRKTRRLVVVHEDNRNCGFGAEVAAEVAEHAGVPVAIRRVARADTYVPCNYQNQLEVLPSVRRVLEAVAGLCDLEVEAEGIQPDSAGGAFILEAVGSSPADQNVTVIQWRVKEGDRVKAGDLLAECEADKATFDLRAPVAGTIHGLLAPGQTVTVGTPMARIEKESGLGVRVRRVPLEPRWRVRRRESMALAPSGAVASRDAMASVDRGSPVVGLMGLSFVTGARFVPNAELLTRFPGRTSEDIIQRTGIESRFYCAEGETVLDLAVKASRAALAASGLTLADLDSILVSTSTPLAISPSLACRLHHVLSLEGPTRDLPAHDLLAACSGWLYALQSAFDTCRLRPRSRILVVTAEAMSRFLNPDDFDTAIVFGDAATAVVVQGGEAVARSPIRLHRPLLSARGEDGSILNVGRMQGTVCAPVEMHGMKVFPLAVRQMNAMLQDACAEAGIGMRDLDWIVPHQANGRIIAAAQQRSGLPVERVVNNVARYGNTSSSSIPIALAEMLADGRHGRVGLAAFGGGFTFGAAVAEMG